MELSFRSKNNSTCSPAIANQDNNLSKTQKKELGFAKPTSNL